MTRDAIVAEARAWVGTPYRHQSSAKGAGCDCVGLVRGVWRGLVGAEPEPLPAYAPDWDEGGAEHLRDALARHFRSVTVDEAEAGDVLLFRMVAGAAIKHAAILVTPDAVVHAYWGRAVVESRLTPFWRSRIAAAFSFPGVS